MGRYIVAIKPLRSARLSAAHASTLRIRIHTYLIMNYDIGGDDTEALCMLSHVLTTRIETGSSICFFTLINLYSIGPIIAESVDVELIRHRSNSDTDSNHNSFRRVTNDS
ncbi:hypothetical protein PIROE2DRAFT_5737 [Piromyces sp. E2]|nr:hypothetical protein PIROE2DRAFT_5737 [Piromyces sp. E2]|eukprot:OUM66994.1 hypothetical protein PIROE2DRAFT_5737 [Piromyces sp. E2]